ncbi:MAG: hypothetical protein ACRC3I_03905 [Cetobacterium sp.]
MHSKVYSFLEELRNIYLNHFSEFEKTINLKRLRSDKIFEEDGMAKEFKNFLDNYLEEVNDFQTKIYEISFKYPELNISMRRKNYESILSKLHRNKEEKFQIIKILNDLFGARCIVENYIEIASKLEDICSDENYRFVDKSQSTEVPYKAWHVYIKGVDNYLFFIELQIWDKENVASNFESHKLYKTGYIKAPVYYSGGELDND